MLVLAFILKIPGPVVEFLRCTPVNLLV